MVLFSRTQTCATGDTSETPTVLRCTHVLQLSDHITFLSGGRLPKGFSSMLKQLFQGTSKPLFIHDRTCKHVFHWRGLSTVTLIGKVKSRPNTIIFGLHECSHESYCDTRALDRADVRPNLAYFLSER